MGYNYSFRLDLFLERTSKGVLFLHYLMSNELRSTYILVKSANFGKEVTQMIIRLKTKPKPKPKYYSLGFF